MMVLTREVDPGNGAITIVMSQNALSSMQEITNLALSRREPPLLWGVDVASCGAGYPNIELGTLLVKECLAEGGRGIAWSYLHHALAVNLVCPLLTLSLLTVRVIPVRQQHPEVYRVYLELASIFTFCLSSGKSGPSVDRVVRCVNEVLQLSQPGEATVTELGTCMIHFLFTLVSRLADAISEDWGIQSSWSDKQKGFGGVLHNQNSLLVANEVEEDAEEKRHEEQDQMKRSNSLIAVDLVAKIMQNKQTASLLRLARKTLVFELILCFETSLVTLQDCDGICIILEKCSWTYFWCILEFITHASYKGQQMAIHEATRNSLQLEMELSCSFLPFLVHLAKQNRFYSSRPEQWSLFTRCLHTLEALTRSPLSTAPKEAPGALGGLADAIAHGLQRDWRPSQLPVIRALLDSGSNSHAFGNACGLGRSYPWLAFDIYIECAMEKQSLHVVSPSEGLADMMKTMQVVQGATWHEVFLGLWTSALRLVHRDREWVEGPRPHVESRLCMLLSLVPLACSVVINEEEMGQGLGDGSNNMRLDNTSSNSSNGEGKEKNFAGSGERRAALISSLQALGQLEPMLYPPQIAQAAANKAAASAAALVASMNANSGLGNEANSMSKTAGNLRHLIVEACISRGLLDSSAYFWHGAIGVGTNLPSTPTSPQSSPWSAFMEGAPLTQPLRSALTSSPAESLSELEKVYQTAISGQDGERAAAASILCGASLTRSWNVQEHAVRLAVRLLSPPAGPENRASGSHLIAHAPMLHAALGSMTSMDAVNIMALYGMFPALAVSLLPICEVFGSLTPSAPRPTGSGEEISVHSVFSLAFLLLTRLWKFHRPPLEHCLFGSGAGLGADLSLQYLVQLHNLQSHMNDKGSKETLLDQHSKGVPGYGLSRTTTSKAGPPASPLPAREVITLESYPRLKAWYMQHQACIASTITGLLRSNPVHQVADRLLSMIFKKHGKSASSSSVGTPSNSSGNSVGHGSGDERPALAAWDIIAAVPLVVDEVLTACAHGRLSPRDLTTGLRELVDYLPATVATITSCFTAEVTRGFHKSASMNGNDWPSPAGNLIAVEAEIQEILASAGVSVPSLVTGTVGGNAPASLPLPMAALVSLTITFKLDKTSEMTLGVAGPALEHAGAGGPWPSTAVVAALWTQKMRRWHDFIVFNASRAVFKQNKDAVSQLLKSCFTATLGSGKVNSKLQHNGGVGALLGHGHWLPALCGINSIAPGKLYLRSFPVLHDLMFLSGEILTLVSEASRDVAALGQVADGEATSVTNSSRLRCVHMPLNTSLARGMQASTLGACLLYVAGGATLVRNLFKDCIPTWLLAGVEIKCTPCSSKYETKRTQSTSKGTIIEGYAVARFAHLAGALAWGISMSRNASHQADVSTDMQREQVLGLHLDLIASGLDGKISIGCQQTTWRAYVIGFLGLMVTCTPAWILDVKTETLKRLATGLRWWHQHDLAFALLEHGCPSAISAAAEYAI